MPYTIVFSIQDDTPFEAPQKPASMQEVAMLLGSVAGGGVMKKVEDGKYKWIPPHRIEYANVFESKLIV